MGVRGGSGPLFRDQTRTVDLDLGGGLTIPQFSPIPKTPLSTPSTVRKGSRPQVPHKLSQSAFLAGGCTENRRGGLRTTLLLFSQYLLHFHSDTFLSHFFSPPQLFVVWAKLLKTIRNQSLFAGDQPATQMVTPIFSNSTINY